MPHAWGLMCWLRDFWNLYNFSLPPLRSESSRSPISYNTMNYIPPELDPASHILGRGVYRKIKLSLLGMMGKTGIVIHGF